ncbi:MAG: phosphonate C-P lyase system protein PhnH [Hyphomicrobiales bacterium]
MLNRVAHSVNGDDVVSGGFVNPVFEAQSTFKTLMDAMARPGTHQAVKATTISSNGINSTVAALILTLCDADTPVWLDPTLDLDAFDAWIRFHTGAPLCKQPNDAQFGVCANPIDMPALSSFMQGTQDYPDRSTTLIVQCQSLQGGPTVALSGPGIPGEEVLSLPDVPSVFIELWQANREIFPRGVDVIFAGQGAVMSLPRSTRLRRENEELEL